MYCFASLGTESDRYSEGTGNQGPSSSGEKLKMSCLSCSSSIPVSVECRRLSLLFRFFVYFVYPSAAKSACSFTACLVILILELYNSFHRRVPSTVT